MNPPVELRGLGSGAGWAASRPRAILGLVAIAVAAAPARATAAAADEFVREASWRIPTADEVRASTRDWLAASGATADASAARRAGGVWGAEMPPADPLDAVMETISIIDPRAATLRERSDGPLDIVPEWLDDPAVAAFERDAVKLWLGRQLVRQRRFDEAYPLLAGLDPRTAVDPVTLLFHRAACAHWLLDTEAALESLDRLLERADEIPVRYERLARLMRHDISGLDDEESLAHIARRMRDVTRRLDLARAGPATRQVQDGVVESLDRLIEKLERERQRQQSQAGQGSGGAGGGGGGARPMDDSRIAGGRGAGDVRSKELGADDVWGGLPPHAREEALQQIGREFPPHYRDVIERYFKRLAAGAEDR